MFGCCLRWSINLRKSRKFCGIWLAQYNLSVIKSLIWSSSTKSTQSIEYLQMQFFSVVSSIHFSTLWHNTQTRFWVSFLHTNIKETKQLSTHINKLFRKTLYQEIQHCKVRSRTHILLCCSLERHCQIFRLSMLYKIHSGLVHCPSLQARLVCTEWDRSVVLYTLLDVLKN